MLNLKNNYLSKNRKPNGKTNYREIEWKKKLFKRDQEVEMSPDAMKQTTWICMLFQDWNIE